LAAVVVKDRNPATSDLGMRRRWPLPDLWVTLPVSDARNSPQNRLRATTAVATDGEPVEAVGHLVALGVIVTDQKVLTGGMALLSKWRTYRLAPSSGLPVLSARLIG
jgi:hypothetical protein